MFYYITFFCAITTCVAFTVDLSTLPGWGVSGLQGIGGRMLARNPLSSLAIDGAMIRRGPQLILFDFQNMTFLGSKGGFFESDRDDWQNTSFQWLIDPVDEPLTELYSSFLYAVSTRNTTERPMMANVTMLGFHGDAAHFQIRDQWQFVRTIKLGNSGAAAMRAHGGYLYVAFLVDPDGAERTVWRYRLEEFSPPKLVNCKWQSGEAVAFMRSTPDLEHLVLMFGSAACIIDAHNITNTRRFEWDVATYGNLVPLASLPGVGASFVSNMSLLAMSEHADGSAWLVHFSVGATAQQDGAVAQYRVSGVTRDQRPLTSYGVSSRWLFVRYVNQDFPMLYWFPLQPLPAPGSTLAPTTSMWVAFKNADQVRSIVCSDRFALFAVPSLSAYWRFSFGEPGNATQVSSLLID